MSNPLDEVDADLRALLPRTASAARPRLAAVGQSMRRVAQARAAWSTRIPSSVRVTSTADGVEVTAGGSKAPHAGVFEHGGQPGTVRHPVYGHRNVQVVQQARPFLAPAQRETEPLADSLMTGALDDTARSLGFH